MLALAEMQLGHELPARTAAHRALDAGLPAGRFLAGPREFTAPLLDDGELRSRVEALAGPVVSGPLLGRVSDTSAGLWVRTARAAAVEARVYSMRSAEPVAVSNTAMSSPETDFTASVDVKGLSPNTRYRYEIFADGELAPATLSTWFTTAPVAGEGAVVRVAFGGGAGYVPDHEFMWNTIRSHAPDALFLLGDNVYSDDPGRPEIQRYCYYRRQSRPEWQALTAATPVYAIWDDHDFSTNDSWGGPHLDWPPWKPRVWETFQQNWCNPPYAGGDRPGSYFTWAIGDIDFFFLDGRFYRTNPAWKERTMLGEEQRAWLLQALSKSEATFKVIVSPVPWAESVKPGSRDTWDGYRDERAMIFDHIAANRIDGVFLLSADRHRSDAWLIPRENSYDLYEFESSRLTNQHVHPTFEAAIFSYNEWQSFGMLDFDTTTEDPKLTYTIVNIHGDSVHSLTVPLSDVTHP
jgi:alkaline phosphatase D